MDRKAKAFENKNEMQRMLPEAMTPPLETSDVTVLTTEIVDDTNGLYLVYPLKSKVAWVWFNTFPVVVVIFFGERSSTLSLVRFIVFWNSIDIEMWFVVESKVRVVLYASFSA